MARGSTSALQTVLAPLPAPAWGGLHAVIASIHPVVRDRGFNLCPVVPTGDLLERFSDLGVDAIGLDQSRIRRSLNPAHHWRFLNGLFRDPQALAALARAHQAKVFQLAGLQHVQGALASRQAGTALVWQIHSDILPAPARRILTPYARRASDVIMVNGPQVRQAFPGVARFDANRVVEFRAPINTARFTFDAESRASARQRLGIAADEIVIGTIGNQTHQKAHDRIVDLADDLSDQDQIRFVILGGAVDSNRTYYRDSVLDPARDRGLLDSRRLQIIDAGSRVADYLPAFDLFVMPSRAEGIPVALLEAMASGLPVVMTDVGSVREAVLDGENGFLVKAEPFERNRFARSVSQLVKDPDLRARMGRRSREIAQSRFSAETVAEAHVAAYRKALAHKAGQSEAPE